MNARIFVAGKADVADFARFLRFESRFQPSFFDNPVGIAIVDHLMKLPQIDAVGTKAPQALLEILFRAFVIALAVFRHEKNLIAPSAGGKSLTHPLFRTAVMVVPGVIEEVNPLVDGRMHNLNRFVFFLDGSDVPATQAENRYPFLGTTKHASWNSGGTGRGLCQYVLRQRDGQRGSQERMKEFTSGRS